MSGITGGNRFERATQRSIIEKNNKIKILKLAERINLQIKLARGQAEKMKERTESVHNRIGGNSPPDGSDGSSNEKAPRKKIEKFMQPVVSNYSS